MNKKMIWGIVVALAFTFFWLIFDNSDISTDHFLLRALRSMEVELLAIGVVSAPIMILTVLFTGPSSFWSRFYRVLPFYLIVLLTIFIIVSVKLTQW